MTRPMETLESQHQAFPLVPTAAWSLANAARFPHFPQLRRLRLNLGIDDTYYRCFPRPWVTFLPDPTDTGLGYLVK